MRAAIAHLIEVHGRRRLAFIRGPLTHREAGERYRSYCDALAAYGIPFDPDLVSPPYLWVQADGTELPANGAEAVRLFLEDRRVSFDAIVAASDTFALGAVPALQACGLQVPEQVSVIGFDDRPASRALTPPLTTLKISMQERGRQALSMLLARLAGESLPNEVSLPAHLVIRRSCGCFDSAVVRAASRVAGSATLPAGPAGISRSRGRPSSRPLNESSNRSVSLRVAGSCCSMPAWQSWTGERAAYMPQAVFSLSSTTFCARLLMLGVRLGPGKA